MGPVAERFREWASASRTFSAITNLIAVVQRELDRLCSFSSPCMHALPPPACLLRLLLTAATFSPSRHHHQTWRWCAWLPYATAASRRQPRAACVTVQAPFTACSLWHDHNPIRSLLAQGKPVFLRAVYLSMSIARQQNSRQRFLCGETSTAPEQRRP